jgi:hypothetical protein
LVAVRGGNLYLVLTEFKFTQKIGQRYYVIATIRGTKSHRFETEMREIPCRSNLLGKEKGEGNKRGERPLRWWWWW